MKDTTKETLASALRHLLTAIGAVGVTHGYLSNSQMAEVVGAIVALFGAIWGPLDEYLAARKVDEDERIKTAVAVAVQAALANRVAATPAPVSASLNP